MLDVFREDRQFTEIWNYELEYDVIVDKKMLELLHNAVVGWILTRWANKD